jgi:TonB family protein
MFLNILFQQQSSQQSPSGSWQTAPAVTQTTTTTASPSTDQDSIESVVPLGKDVTPPEAISSPEPDLGHSFWGRGLKNGICTVGLIVDSQGDPQEIHIVQGLTPRQDKAAQEAASHYRFKPAMKDGKPVAVRVNIQFDFRIIGK